MHENFENEDECFNYYRDEFIDKAKNTMTTKANSNVYSVYNDYDSLNSNLCSPIFYGKYLTSEPNRILLTKYRTGSHYLHIQTGRAANIPRNERLCKCMELQTLRHVIFDCIHTRYIQVNKYPTISNLHDFFEQDINVITGALMLIEKTLKLR